MGAETGTVGAETGTLRSVTATRYVTPLREGGSLPGLVEADDDGLYVAKFRGAGQGGAALVADLVGGELARLLGMTQLGVPELVLLTVDPAMSSAEPDEEVQDLLAASAGVNLGVDFLPGSLTWTPAAATAGGLQPGPELAAGIVWLDGLITNVDRTARNTNLLAWHHRLYVIDHGASLFRQHAWSSPADAEVTAGAGFPQLAEHVLLDRAAPLASVDDSLASLVTEDAVEAILTLPPEPWFDRPGETPGAGGWRRAAIGAHLMGRLDGRHGVAGFVTEADALIGRARG